MALVARSLLTVLSLASMLESASGATHTVALNDMPVWTVGMGLSYSDMTITVGQTLSFTSSNTHDVALLIPPPSSGSPWDVCTMTGIAAGNKTPIFANSDFSASNAEKHYTPPTCGVYYIACSIPPHCAYGQRVKVTVNNVDGTACGSPCAGAGCVTVASKQAVATAQNVFGVKPILPMHSWGIAFYDDMSVNIGDTVLFKTGPGHHDIATVPDATAYSSCTTTNKVLLAEWAYSASGDINVSPACTGSEACCAGTSCGKDGMYATYTYTATMAGDVHFVCSVGAGVHCQQGQKFKLTVNTAIQPETASGASLVKASSSALILAVFAHFLLRL